MSQKRSRILALVSVDALTAEAGLGTVLRGVRSLRGCTRKELSAELEEKGFYFPDYRIANAEKNGLRSIEDSMEIFGLLSQEKAGRGALEAVSVDGKMYFSSRQTRRGDTLAWPR